MEAYEENLGAVDVAEEPVAEPIKQEMTESETIKEEVESIQDIREPENVSIEKRWPGWPGDSVFRILVPGQKVGGIIGRKGEFIKKMCEETRARIKILDGPPGIQERAVLISAKEEHDAAISPAMDGLLSVHRRSVDGLEGDFSKIPQNTENVIITRLLVPASQAGSLIGKHGATIKYIQEASSCAVRILEDFCAFSLPDDRMVEVQGEPAGVHKAVELIAGQLRKFLVDRTVLPLFETYHMPMQNSHMEHNMPPPHNMPPHNMPLPPPQSWSHPQGSSSFGGNPSFMPPRQPHDNFYPPSDMRSMEKEPQHGVSAHGREHPSHLGGLSADQPQGVTSQVTHHIQIQLSYADAVIGAAGANISYIRRASGATITIQETRGVPAEMTVEINGSATQVQTAQQLIQNFIAEAGAPTRNPAPSTTDQGYSSFQNQGSNSYMSPANPGPPRPSPGGYGYASGYGTNYGY